MVAVLGGLGYMVTYQGTPGKDAEAPAKMPTAGVAEEKRPTLIMFAHPQCPCTRASIGELGVIMARNQGKVAAKVLFVQPEGMKMDWTQADLWKSAAEIPGVTVGIDEGGRLARQFQVNTSGAVVVYDVAGGLLFQGGITDGRGHAGDNEGRDAVEAVLNGRKPVNLKTPTYGCALASNPLDVSSVWSR